MITVTIIIEETPQAINAAGVIRSLEKPTKREERLARGIMKAIEAHLTEQKISGSIFIRHEFPNEKSHRGTNKKEQKE